MGWTLAFFMGTIACAQAADFEFRRGPTLPPDSSWRPSNVAVGDVDGDGRDDLAITEIGATWNVGRLRIRLQMDGGAFAPPIDSALYAGAGAPVHIVDLDGDGAGEIIYPQREYYGLAIRRWNGTGFSDNAVDTPFGCGFLETGDIDGNGRPDILCHGGQISAALFYTLADGTLSAPTYFSTPAGYWGSSWKGLRMADVTGDGRTDLVITADDANSFFVYVNNGLGGFFPPTAYPHPLGMTVYPTAIEVIDIDGDGVPEVVTADPANQPDSRLLVYRRQPNGFLAFAYSKPVHDAPTAMVAHDLDQDGRKDLVLGHYEFNTVGRVMVASALGPELLSPAPGFEGHSNGIALGDLNDDGHVDAAAATGSGVVLHYGRRLRTRTDLNGDFESDVLWRRATLGQNIAWLSANNTTPMGLQAVGTAWEVVAMGDFNGDDRGDIVWRHSTTGANVIWRGGNASTPQSVAAMPDLEWIVAGAGDFDGDGTDDLLWHHRQTGASAIWRSAMSAAQIQVTTLDPAWKIAAVGDFDGDGEADILWRHSMLGANAIWRSGRSNAPKPMATVSDLGWRIVAVGDFDQDGRDDLFWRHSTTGANSLWKAAEIAGAAQVRAVTDVDWRVAASGDFDGDGVEDIAWRHATSGANVVWRQANPALQMPMAGVAVEWRIVP